MQFFCFRLDEKKNVGTDVKISPPHEHMVKRETIYDDYQNANSEILEPVYQIPELDYDDLNQALNELYGNDDADIHEDKRFLGKYSITFKKLLFTILYTNNVNLTKLYSHKNTHELI